MNMNVHIMGERELKIIGNKISEGHFEEYKEALGKTIKVSQKQAIHLLVCCCTTCNSNINEPDKLSEQDVMILVKNTSKSILDVSNEEYDTYLQSMFFICKLLLRKNFKLVLELEDEIIPTFIVQTLTETQKGIYRALCELIRGEVMNIISRKQGIDENEMVSVGYLLSKILIKSENQKFLFEVIHNYGSCLMILNVDLKLQYNYFMFNCGLAKDISVEVLSATFLHFIRYGINIFSSNLRNGIVEDADKIITNLLSITPLLKEWKIFKGILQICKHLINASVEMKSLIKYKDLFLASAKLFEKNENFQNICKIISLAVNSFSYFCKNHDNGKKFSNPEVHSCVYEILHEIMKFFIHLSEADKKTGVRNLREVSELTTSILILFNTLLLNKHVNHELTTKVLIYLEKYCEFLVSLKNYCDKLDITWSESAVYLYNLGVIYFRNEDNKATLSVSYMILKYHILFGKLDDKVVLPNVMGLLGSVYLKEKKYIEALTWTSMHIIYSKETSKNTVFNKYLKIKAAARENDAPTLIQELTVCSVIQHIPPEYECYSKQILNLQTQIDLLIFELKVYHQKWKSKIPMMSAFRQLCDIADNFTLMGVFIEVFSDWETHVHETVIVLLERIFVEYEMSLKKCKTIEHRIFLLFMYFFRYKIQNIEIIAKNVEEINKNSTPPKPPEYPVDIMPADAYDQCDVVSTYEGLNINGNKMKNLEQCLKELEGIVTSDLTKSTLKDINLMKIYTLAINLALEFHLHSDAYHSFKSFYSAFNIAVYSENKILILECGGHLLKYLRDNKLETRLDKEVSKLKTDQQNMKYLVQYYINLSYLYLFDNNVPVAIKKFNSALEYLDNLHEVNEKHFWRIDISIELLRFKLMQASKMSKLATEIKSSFGSLMKAHDLMVQKYSSEVEWGPSSMLLYFDLMESIVKLYHDLKMPREVRCFGKQSLTLAQQYQIPMLSVKFLNYLAHADFRSERWFDCKVKLDGISEILLLEKDKEFLKPGTLEINCQTDELVKSITEGIEEMRLEVNKASFNVKSSPSSPVYIGDTYKHPQFSGHKNCECFKCTCFEYQQLAGSRYHLEALWYMYKKQITLAKSYFKGTSEFYQILTVKERVIPKNLPSTPYLSIDAQTASEKKLSFNEYNYQCSIDYIKFLYSSGAHNSARKQCDSLISQLKAEKNIYPHLYGEVLLLKLGIIFHKRVKDKVVHDELSIPCKDNFEFKTPEKCKPKIIFAEEVSPKIKRILPPKVIKFSLADLEGDSKDKKTPLKFNNKRCKTPLKTPRNKILPPSLRSTLTPLFKTPSRKASADIDELPKASHSIKTPISKSLASDNKASSDNHMRRRPLVEILEPSQSSDNNSITKITNQNEVSVKDQNFDIRTKLLTAKIKKKIIETPVSSDICDEQHIVTRSSRRKRL